MIHPLNSKIPIATLAAFSDTHRHRAEKTVMLSFSLHSLLTFGQSRKENFVIVCIINNQFLACQLLIFYMYKTVINEMNTARIINRTGSRGQGGMEEDVSLW